MEGQSFMITAARKSSTLDPSAKSRVGHKHGLGRWSINSSVPTSSNTYIQKKSACACGGGCPCCLGVIQPKLRIGQPNDIYEQEADRVADAVMRLPEPKLQRQPEAEEEETVQMQYRSAVSPRVSPSFTSQLQHLKDGGLPLARSTLDYYEPRFGRNLKQVRVHADSNAHQAAKAVNARAFTMGRHVVFGTGQYAPQTSEGRRLLAHELTHVVQQSHASPTIQLIQRVEDVSPRCRYLNCPPSPVLDVEILLNDGSRDRLSHVYPIDPMGFLRMPLLGSIPTIGLSLPQIRQDIHQRALRYYLSPVITVRHTPSTVDYCRRIQPGDTLFVRIFDNTGRILVSGAYTVDAHGMITMPTIGPVPTTGLSLYCLVLELEQHLQGARSPGEPIYASNAQVSMTALVP